MTVRIPHRSSAAGLGFPVTAYQSEKICPVGAGFGENFVAARAVVPNCRGDDQHSRFLLEPRKRIDEDASGVDAAAAKKLFASFCPAAISDSRAA